MDVRGRISCIPVGSGAPLGEEFAKWEKDGGYGMGMWST
ncbi:predicted protein [Sclerotinia sclerotiorum 1980 UF-70]|uniref:Uncharacterized protein n=1 Tax=Sclerotinia sclerotiorum (strain ATCC 18683 / 1980 / Ss-1) TaxID=665079 RepID=A7E4K8_SCLS1|nr:predicted protein [Sclerotinia sclerotiorum 1980 UF-70]EDN90830.1 predicted protein [Sclerotinia sclerotiorum 1980 UF-70]